MPQPGRSQCSFGHPAQPLAITAYLPTSILPCSMQQNSQLPDRPDFIWLVAVRQDNMTYNVQTQAYLQSFSTFCSIYYISVLVLCHCCLSISPISWCHKIRNGFTFLVLANKRAFVLWSVYYSNLAIALQPQFYICFLPPVTLGGPKWTIMWWHVTNKLMNK